jgi:hypothetical protein
VPSPHSKRERRRVYQGRKSVEHAPGSRKVSLLLALWFDLELLIIDEM